MPVDMFPPFEPQMPVWPHRDLYSFSNYFDDKYEEPARSRVLEAAAAQDIALAGAGEVSSGLLWVPNPEEGMPLGGGYLRLIDVVEPTSIEQVLEEREIYYPFRKEKVHQYEVYREADIIHGPTGVQYVASTMGRSKDIHCSISVWMVPDPHSAIEAKITHFDPINNEAVIEALMRFIALSKLEAVS